MRTAFQCPYGGHQMSGRKKIKECEEGPVALRTERRSDGIQHGLVCPTPELVTTALTGKIKCNAGHFHNWDRGHDGRQYITLDVAASIEQVELRLDDVEQA